VAKIEEQSLLFSSDGGLGVFACFGVVVLEIDFFNFVDLPYCPGKAEDAADSNSDDFHWKT